MSAAARLWTEFGLGLMRRRLLLRALRNRRSLIAVADRTPQISATDILCFAAVRDEATQIGSFLDHHRKLGVDHFLVVDNASADGTADELRRQPDVSLWQTEQSYREARLGMDWLAWLLARHGHGHWCATLDADERLVYPHHDTRPLRELTNWLDRQGIEALAAQLLDLYPRGRLSAADNSTHALCWFDGWGYTCAQHPRFGGLTIRGGARQRAFFSGTDDPGPYLQKVPLIRWNRRFVYASSTHAALPRRLNRGLDARLGNPTGVLLHLRFSNQAIVNARDEKTRRQRHAGDGARYERYYDAVLADPVLWTPDSVRLEDWRQLERLGLMTRGLWD